MYSDEFYMQRCLDLAENALGKTYPNPIVGCVIVHEGKIIGESWHKKAGDAHAEVNAINSVKDKTLLSASTLYVSLEPCVHYGKTPPCSELIIKHRIPNVVVVCKDLYSKVSGKGIQSIRESGIKVDVGILEDQCIESHKRFFTFHNKKRPYIILKWAETNDGFIAPKEQKVGEPFWITSVESKTLVHKWRSQEHGILIGGKTYIDDSPILNSRLWDNNNPKKFVLTNNTNIKDSKFFKINYKNKLSAKQICEELYKSDIQSVIVEGGTKTLTTFINDGIWDEARIIQSSKTIGEGIKSPKIQGKIYTEFEISNDRIKFIVSN